jgi:hypothetical protein
MGLQNSASIGSSRVTAALRSACAMPSGVSDESPLPPAFQAPHGLFMPGQLDRLDGEHSCGVYRVISAGTKDYRAARSAAAVAPRSPTQV